MLHEEAASIFRTYYGPKRQRYAYGVANIGFNRLFAGDNQTAETRFRDSIDIYRKTEAVNKAQLSLPLTGLAQALLSRGQRLEEAEAAARQAWEIRRSTFPAGNPLRAVTQSVLGGVLVARGRFDEAEPLLTESHEALVKVRHLREARIELARLEHFYRVSGRRAAK